MVEIEIAERLLGENWGGEVRLTLKEVLRKDRCYRFQVAGLATSVIVKRATGEDGSVHRLLDEWAALAFIEEIAPGGGLAPRFFGGDREACLIVYEDLGEGPSLVEPLMGDDPDQARAALRGHAEAVGRLHNASGGGEARFREIRDGLGPAATRRGGLGWGVLSELREDLARGFDLLHIKIGDDFWADYQTLTEAICAEPLRAFVHNDSCPDNMRLTGEGVRLFDFEVGGFHHRLLDAAYARMSMPHCYLSNVVPPEVVRETEGAYREVSKMTGDRQFGEEMVHACFYWVVSNGIWRVAERLDQEDFTWGIATWRQRVFHRLGALAEACDEFAYMPAVAKAARETVFELRKRWDVEPLPLYPAFRAAQDS